MITSASLNHGLQGSHWHAVQFISEVFISIFPSAWLSIAQHSNRRITPHSSSPVPDDSTAAASEFVPDSCIHQAAAASLSTANMHVFVSRGSLGVLACIACAGTTPDPHTTEPAPQPTPQPPQQPPPQPQPQPQPQPKSEAPKPPPAAAPKPQPPPSPPPEPAPVPEPPQTPPAEPPGWVLPQPQLTFYSEGLSAHCS